MADTDVFKGRSTENAKLAIRLRRDLHRIPEPPFAEVKTSAYIQDFLKKESIPFSSGLAKTGVLARIRGKGRGKTLLLRADMDGVPIPEEKTGLPFSSEHPGMMHACGHDTHVAMLLTAGKILNSIRDRFPGTLMLLFQPAEESWGGGREILKSPRLDTSRIDAAAALHIWGALKAGKLGYIPGKAFAYSDRFDITVIGKGSHGASPYKAVDPITGAAQIINALNTIISRKVKYTDQAVISFGAVNGGSTYNVIPESVQIIGTWRTLDSQLRKFIKSEIEKTARFTAKATGLKTDITYMEGYPVMYNNPEITEFGRSVAEKVFGRRNTVQRTPVMGGEDFSYLLEKVPGAMFLLGGAPTNRGEVHHSADFNIDESVLIKGIEFLCRFSQQFLEAGTCPKKTTMR